MYCRACGRPLPSEAAFCPGCGAAQQTESATRPPSTLHPVWVVLALFMLPPLGLILMWTSSGWNHHVKWAISGLFFPPLWLRFLWTVWWLPYVVSALLGLSIVRGAVEGGLSVFGAVALLVVISVILLLTRPKPPAKRPSPTAQLDALRQKVEAQLDACHELIADLEGTVALDLLPAGDPIRLRYSQALEIRAEGARLLDRAASWRDVEAADRRVVQALDELRAVRGGLPDADRG